MKPRSNISKSKISGLLLISIILIISILQCSATTARAAFVTQTSTRKTIQYKHFGKYKNNSQNYVSSSSHRNKIHSHKNFIFHSLSALGSSNDSNSNDGEEEVLLMMKFSLTEPKEDSTTSVVEKVRDYLRSFPFAAVLPVQPLQYLPSEQGVNVTFLRKKTKEKGSVDGGIVIDAVVEGENEITLIARRNSEGQFVGKIFSEKIVINALVDGFERSREDLNVEVKSVFHKWLE